MSLLSKVNLILLFLSVASCSLPALNWNEIIEKNKKHLLETEASDLSDRGALIAYALMNEKGDAADYIEDYIKTHDDSILIAMYLSMKLTDIGSAKDESLLYYLMKYYEIDNRNSIPCYYLSYYYFRQNDLELGIRYIQEGNEKEVFELYTTDKKKIVYDYLIRKTSNEILALSSQFCVFDPGFMFVVRYLSTRVKSLQTRSELESEIMKLGEKIENNSISLLEKLFGISIQLSGIDRRLNPLLHGELERRHKSFLGLMSKLNNKKGKPELMDYLWMAFIQGEVYALQNLE